MNAMLSLGIDFGTSGARAIAVDTQGQIHAQTSLRFSSLTPQVDQWRSTLFELIEQIPLGIRQSIGAIALDGTSSTVLLCDQYGDPLDTPILYHDDRGVAVLDWLHAIAPPGHPVLSATSSLAKLLWWSQQPQSSQARYLLHQADWLAFLLHGKLGISDYHNSLKLGYDVGKLCYPAWLRNLTVASLLPRVLPPGTPVGKIKPAVSDRFSLPSGCVVCAGTTDSIAAFLASGATTVGESVTSLGSTLVLKLLSQTRVDNADYGIYSHRLGDRWLVGGASNTGGAVLKQFFNNDELYQFSAEIDPHHVSLLDYYPLLKQGDRFPVNDPHMLPRLTPRPESPVEFLHGLLESMARIETQGYRLIAELGAAPLTRVYTAGGGAANATWTAIRARHLQVPITTSAQTEACLMILGELPYQIRPWNLSFRNVLPFYINLKSKHGR